MERAENEEEKRENSKTEEDRKDKFKEKLQQSREEGAGMKDKRAEWKNGEGLNKEKERKLRSRRK